MDTITDISTAYNMGVEDVERIFNHYMSKGMTQSKAMYYTQLACASLTDNSII